METSVIVVLWNAEATLDACLRSIPRRAHDVQVVCVDNDSVDDSLGIAAAHGSEIVSMGRNAGFAVAVNHGALTATGEHLLLLNPDVVLESDTLEIARAALREPNIGLVGANLIRPDGTPDPPAARRFRTLRYLLIETLGLHTISRRFNHQYLPDDLRHHDRDVDAINGAFMLMRRELFWELGGMDDSVFLFLEDQDLCRRVRERGLRVRFVASARALHVGGAATGAARVDQKANIHLHRMDASIELIRRIQGETARRVAIGLWTIRCLLGLVARGVRSSSERHRYGGGLRWLARQWAHRVPPPPVP